MPLHIGRYGVSPDRPEGDGHADDIEAIGIDETGGLWVKPATMKFPHIYREAMEVGWDESRHCLTSPKPRDWSYLQWFEQIVKAAHKQGSP